MSEYIISVDENDERWHYVEQQYTHFFGYPITDEIVRCRDCKWFNASAAVHTWCARLVDMYGNILTFDAEPDDYCAWGERRDS